MSIVKTDRLSLRKIDTDDADFMLRLLNDPAFIQYVGDKNTPVGRDLARVAGLCAGGRRVPGAGSGREPLRRARMRRLPRIGGAPRDGGATALEAVVALRRGVPRGLSRHTDTADAVVSALGRAAPGDCRVSPLALPLSANPNPTSSTGRARGDGQGWPPANGSPKKGMRGFILLCGFSARLYPVRCGAALSSPAATPGRLRYQGMSDRGRLGGQPACPHG